MPDEHAVLVGQGVHAAEGVLPVVLLEALGEDLLEQRAGGGEGLGLERPGVRDADLGHARRWWQAMSSGPCASLPCHDRTADREGRPRHGRVAAMARRPAVGGGLGRAARSSRSPPTARARSSWPTPPRCRSASTGCPTAACSSSTGAAGASCAARPTGRSPRTRTSPRVAAPPWNDIVVDARGNAYVGATGFEFPGGEFAPGLIALVTPDGAVRPVADGVAFPNGIAITPDGGTLILAESYGNRLTAWDIAADGGLSGRRVWADLGDGVPDGICVDTEGAVWYADVPNRCCVRVREGGEVLERVDLDRGGFACMLGGADGATLFVVASEWRGPARVGEERGTGQVLAVAAPAPHAGRP